MILYTQAKFVWIFLSTQITTVLIGSMEPCCAKQTMESFPLVLFSFFQVHGFFRNVFDSLRSAESACVSLGANVTSDATHTPLTWERFQMNPTSRDMQWWKISNSRLITDLWMHYFLQTSGWSHGQFLYKLSIFVFLLPCRIETVSTGDVLLWVLAAGML